MYSNIEITLNRSDELFSELTAEYEISLKNKHVSDKAIQLTHDVCEKLRSALDRTARRYWEIHVRPVIPEEHRKTATIYFPITPNQSGFDAVLGRWRWKSVREDHQPLYDFLLSKQPFTASVNLWLRTLNDITNQGKHIDLVAQVRKEERRITVQSPGGGSVSWTSGVVFGSGISIGGAPIDPSTQRIVPTPGYTESIETWVSFIIDGYNVNALGFLEEARKQTRSIASEMHDIFEL